MGGVSPGGQGLPTLPFGRPRNALRAKRDLMDTVAAGRVTGRSTTSGNQTTIYGSDGRRVGTVTTKP